MKLCNCAFLIGMILTSFLSIVEAADPVVFNARASQRTGTKLVDIYYDVTDADGDLLSVTLAASVTNVPIQILNVSGDISTNKVSPGINRLITWDAGSDWGNNFSTSVCLTVTASDVKTNFFFPICTAMVGTNNLGKVFVGKRMNWRISNVYPRGKYTVRYKLSPPMSSMATASNILIDSGAMSIYNTYTYVGTKYCEVTLEITDAQGFTYIGTCTNQTLAVPYDGTVIEQ